MDTITLVDLAVGAVLPLIVGLVTKEVTNSGVKAVLLAALAALAGVGQAYVDDNGILTDATLTDAVTYFVIAVTSYFGVLKPTGVSGAVQSATKNVGV